MWYMAESTILGLFLACTCSVVLNACVIWYILTRSAPEHLVRECRLATEAMNTAGLRLDAVEMRVQTWKSEIDDLLGAVDDSLSRAETKRKRADATEQRNAQRQNAGRQLGAQEIDITQLPRDEQLAWARQRLGRPQ